jgi:hypothetical protein
MGTAAMQAQSLSCARSGHELTHAAARRQIEEFYLRAKDLTELRGCRRIHFARPAALAKLCE